MTWPTPQFSRNQVNKAGRILAAESTTEEESVWAQSVLGNWRACHGYPINTFQATLRTKLQRMSLEAIVAQRLKRAPSILSKLRRFDSMQLARMQDIGGIRAVVNSLATVRKLESDYDVSRFGHELISRKDYIASPKQDGYRGIHLVFRYKNSRAPAYEGLLLELQIRTRLQHAWATAVETMGTFLGQALKSHQGEHRWLKFFELAGAAFAHLEKSPLMPDYQNLTRAETFDRLAKAEKDLRVLDKLRGFTIAVDAITTARRSGRYHLVILNSQMKHVEIQAFAKTELEQANAAYTETENRIKAGDPFEAVLVSAGPIESLRRAYPNYFLDTEGFIKKVEQIIKESARSRFHGSPNQVVKP